MASHGLTADTDFRHVCAEKKNAIIEDELKTLDLRSPEFIDFSYRPALGSPVLPADKLKELQDRNAPVLKILDELRKSKDQAPETPVVRVKALLRP